MSAETQPPRLSGSWGLVIDLGDAPTAEHLKQLYDSIWQDEAVSGPRFRLGQFMGLPRAAEGELRIAGQPGKCYTKFEVDDLGYPAGWQAPVSFTFSLFGFADNLPANQVLYDFLLARAEALTALVPWRMALIGDLSCYYLNAELINEDWLDLHQGSVLGLLLPPAHPLTRSHPGQARGANQLYERPELKAFASSDDDQARYLRFKQRISRDLHSPRQRLDWESPNQN